MISDGQGWAQPPSDIDWKARAQIDEFDMKCKISKDQATVQITVKVAAERQGDVTDSLRQELPFFIASMRGDQVVEKKTEMRAIDFASRSKTAKEDYTLSIDLPFENETAADRNILFGFQLNEDQLGYIRSLRDRKVEKLRSLRDPVRGHPLF